NIKKRGNITNLEVKKLESDKDKKNIINKYLEQFLKALDDKQINQICEMKGSDNPLLLKILLTELKSHGQFETLEKQIVNFPTDPQSAFKKVLNRLENEETYTEIDSKKITQLIFSFLSCARYGLSEEELIGTINIYQKENKEEKFSENELKDLIRLKLRQVKPFMKISESRHDYFYDSFKLAATQKYEKDKTQLHQALAKYFKKQADPEENLTFKGTKIRDFNELPYHLKESTNTSFLEEILSIYSWIKNKSELSNIFNTIKDYNYIDYKNKDSKNHLYLIKNTLTMSTHLLKENIKSLPSQLWGRLTTYENPKIKKLLNEINENTDYPWLKSLHQMNTPTGPLKTTLTGHTGDVLSVCFSSKDKYIVSGSYDMSVHVWDLETQEEIAQLKGHENGVNSVHFSSNDKYIVSGSDDRTVRVWDLETQEEIAQLKGHTDWVNSVHFSHNDKYIVSGSDDKTIRIWNLKTQKEITQLKGHTDWVNSVHFSHNDKYIVSGSTDRTVRVWNLKTQKEITQLKGHKNRVNSVHFSSDDKYIVSGSADGSIRVWNLKTQKEIAQLKGHTDWVRNVCFSSKDKYIVSGSDDKTIRIWNLKTQKEITQLKKHTSKVNSVHFSHDDKYIVSGSDDRTVRIWNLKTQKETTQLKKHTSGVNSVCFSSDDNYIVSGSDDRTVRIWNLKTQKEITQLKKHTNQVLSVCFSSGNKYIVSGSADRSVHILDLETQEEIAQLKGHKNWVNSVHFSHDDKYIVSGSDDRTVRVWNLKTQKEITQLKGHEDGVNSVHFSHDDKYIVSGSTDKSIRVWDLETQKEIALLKGHTDWVNSVHFSHDDKYIVSGSTDKTIRIWDLKTQKEITQLKGHKDGVSSVCFSHDDKYVVSGSTDKSVHFWDWQKESCNPIIFLNTDEAINSCTISNNNHQIVAGGSTGQILKYTIENLKLGIAIVTAHRDLDKQLSIGCKYCGKFFKIFEEDLGNIVKCSYCDKELKVNDFTHEPIIVEENNMRIENNDLANFDENSDFNELAIKTHEYYNDLRTKQGLTIDYLSFNDLPEDLKLSNINQAKSIPRKLNLIGCEIASIADKREEVKEFSIEEIESLAELVHEEWVKERVLLGWIYSADKDVDKKLSPYIVPWDELSEKIKDYDRDTIINIPKILNLVDKKVVRSNKDNFNENIFKELAKLKGENNQIYEKNNNFEKERNGDKNSFENNLANDENSKEKESEKKKMVF
ncbi:MAG: RyR domain-containing protein, partial [Methanobrevibacter sp.]|nr:RyR domain-containing protein [Methanobrevibacter sp.]